MNPNNQTGVRVFNQLLAFLPKIKLIEKASDKEVVRLVDEGCQKALVEYNNLWYGAKNRREILWWATQAGLSVTELLEIDLAFYRWNSVRN